MQVRNENKSKLSLIHKKCISDKIYLILHDSNKLNIFDKANFRKRVISGFKKEKEAKSKSQNRNLQDKTPLLLFNKNSIRLKNSLTPYKLKENITLENTNDIDKRKKFWNDLSRFHLKKDEDYKYKMKILIQKDKEISNKSKNYLKTQQNLIKENNNKLVLLGKQLSICESKSDFLQNFLDERIKTIVHKSKIKSSANFNSLINNTSNTNSTINNNAESVPKYSFLSPCKKIKLLKLPLQKDNNNIFTQIE